MSQLTKEEQTAGISRAAIATLRRQNEPPANGATRPRTLAEIISGFVCHRVIDTPMHQIDVLESTDGCVIVRNTEYGENMRAAVTTMVLDYGQAHTLAGILARLEPRAEITGPTKRGRA